MEKFCDRLKQLIDYYAKSKNTFFANLIGMSESNVRSWLAGTLPKIDVIEKIAKSCENISLDWLILGEGPMLKSSQPISAAEERPKDVDNGLVKPLLDRIEAQAIEIYNLKTELSHYRATSTICDPPLNGQD